MAGAGYKLFNTGDVLTAQQVNEYLMQQTVMVFADASARTTALSGVLAEGMLSYLKSDDKTYAYNGTSWVQVGGSSPLTTKGDLYTYSTADARLAVGADGTYLQADSTTSTGLKWGTVSAGGMTSLASGSLAAAQTGVDLQSISSDYNELVLYVTGWSATGAQQFWIRLNNDTGGNYSSVRASTESSALSIQQSASEGVLSGTTSAAYTSCSSIICFPNYKNTTGAKVAHSYIANKSNEVHFATMTWNNTAAINRITVLLAGNAFDAGTYELFGVK